MSASFLAGLAAAIAAAAMYGSAPVAQAVAARDAEAGAGVGLAFTLRLARRPIWLLGLGCEVGAFVLEAYAFSSAPATLVAPVASCDMVIFVILGSLVFGTHWSRLGRLGSVAMAAGVGLLALSLSGDDTLGAPASALQLVGCFGGCAVFAGVAALQGSRIFARGRVTLAAAAFSLASGIAYGVATLATRQIGRTFRGDEPWRLLATPTPYVLVGASLLGIAMMQRGLQASPLLTYPITSAVSAFLPVVVGVVLLDDAVPTGGARAAFVGALLLIGGGVALIARDRMSAER